MQIFEFEKIIQKSFKDKNLRRDISFLIKDTSTDLSRTELNRLKRQIKRLENGEPIAYILGFVPFLDTTIYVNKHTLIPRPETEQLVDMIIKTQKQNINDNTKILDLCSGSGCIAVSISKAFNIKTYAVDIDDNTIKIIRKNAKQNNVLVKTIKSNMFENISQKFNIIVSNPPYIKQDEIKSLNKSVKDFEPHLALDGGKDGLLFYNEIAQKASNYLNKNGLLFLEIGEKQGKQIEKLLKKDFCNIQILKDYFNLPRFIVAKKR